MIVLILLLFSRSTPSTIAHDVDAQAKADSIDASRLLLVPYRCEIESAAKQFAVPAPLIAAVIQEESRFEMFATRQEPRYLRNPRVRRSAISFSRRMHGLPSAETELADRSRSFGLMQVMGETAREQGFTARYLAELYLPANAIAHGAKLLSSLLRRYRGDTLAAISAYNQGSARRRSGVFVNARYVYRVTIAWRAYQALFRS